jgi:hypothetical protein
MMSENDIAPTGTGQEGAGTPTGATAEVPVHIDGKPADKLDELANKAARKGLDRVHRGDATEFTK